MVVVVAPPPSVGGAAGIGERLSRERGRMLARRCLGGGFFFLPNVSIMGPERCTALTPDVWVLVADVDVCPHSRRQVQVAQDLGLSLKGAILCNDEEHRDSAACLAAPHFPMMCHLGTNKCYAGLRETCAQMQELERSANGE